MKRKPWPLVVLALLHVLAPFGNIVFNSLRSHRDPVQTWNFWYYALPMPLFFTYVLLPPLAGIFIYICKRWSYWCYVVCLSFIFFSNIYGFWTQMNLVNFVFVTGVMLVDALAVAYFVAPSVRRVYFDPRMRWWETAPRYYFEVPARAGGQECQIKNIARGGALVEASALWQESDEFVLEWQAEGRSFKLPGKVVYRKPQGPDRSAYGVRFNNSPEARKVMAPLIRKLHQQGKKILERERGPEDSFWAWVKKLFKERKGLFPSAGK